MGEVSATLVLWFVFLIIQVAGIVVAVDWLRRQPIVLPPRQHPRFVFRFVHREDRAAYVRMMRRTMAVQLRDMSRSIDALRRAIALELTPTIERTTITLRKLLDVIR